MFWAPLDRKVEETEAHTRIMKWGTREVDITVDEVARADGVRLRNSPGAEP